MLRSLPSKHPSEDLSGRPVNEITILKGALIEIRPLTWPSMLSSRLLEPSGVDEEVPVDDVREVALQASHGLPVRLPRLALPRHVRLGLGRGPRLDQATE